jgi:hypothetical protein
VITITGYSYMKIFKVLVTMETPKVSN